MHYVLGLEPLEKENSRFVHASLQADAFSYMYF